MNVLALLALAPLFAAQGGPRAPTGGPTGGPTSGPTSGATSGPLGAPSAAPKASTVEPVFEDGNYVGLSFPSLGGAAVDRVDQHTILCVDGIDRARVRLRERGAPIRQPGGISTDIDTAAAHKMADALDALMATRRAEIEDVGVQLSYSQKLKRARIRFQCEPGPLAAMGLKRDDAVMSVGGRAIKGRESAAIALKALDDTPVTAIVVLRDKEEVTLDTTAHQRGVRVLLAAMARRLKMVPDPAEPASMGVAPAAP